MKLNSSFPFLFLTPVVSLKLEEDRMREKTSYYFGIAQVQPKLMMLTPWRS